MSVQVHPDDSFALQHENQLGKTELWYIADAKEDAAIFYGFSRDVEENEIREAIFNKTLSSLLNRIPVKKGDAFFVPAGTVHAILKGVTVIEIQQSSSVTYRLYDYGRKDAQGKERELHVEKALQVVNMKKSLPPSSGTARTECGNTVRLLASCPYFISEEIKTERQAEFENNDGMITLTVSEGEGQFDNGAKAEKGDTFLIPCGVKTFLKGKLTVIKTILHI